MALPGSDAPAALRVVFMGTPQFAAVALQRLLAGAHRTLAVVTRPDRPSGRGQELRPSPVKLLARTHGIEVLEPQRPSQPEFVERLRALAPDVAVVVAYGRLLPAAVLRIPRHACINAHASLLPHLRGAAPIERALLRGDRETGVTIMRINERMDAGDLLSSERVEIGPRSSAGELRETLAPMAAHLIIAALDALAAGRALFTPQDEALATYAPPLEKEEARIDWTSSAVDIDRVVRAFHPTPGAFTFDRGRRLKILAATLAEPAAYGDPGAVLGLRGDAMVVACGQGTLLVRTVQPEGRRPMSAADYAHGCAGGTPRQFTNAAS